MASNSTAGFRTKYNLLIWFQIIIILISLSLIKTTVINLGIIWVQMMNFLPLERYRAYFLQDNVLSPYLSLAFPKETLSS